MDVLAGLRAVLLQWPTLEGLALHTGAATQVDVTYLHSGGCPHPCPTTKPHHSHVFAAGRGAAGALLTERGLIAPPALAAVAVAGAAEAALLPPDVQTAFCRLLALAGAALVLRRAPALATVTLPALCGGKPLCSWS